MDSRVARASLISDSRARGQRHVHDLNGRGEVCRRDVPPQVTGLRIAPGLAILTPGNGGGGRARILEQRSEWHAEARRDLLEHHSRWAAFTAFDQRDHRATHVAL